MHNDMPQPSRQRTPVLKHPFPDEPFSFNAFAVLFGPEATRAKIDAAQRVIGTAGDGTLILEPVPPDATARILEACAAYSGTTVEEVEVFLASVSVSVRGDAE